MTLVLTMIAAWALIALAPGTATARLLHRLLVAAPAAALNRITRGHVLLAILLATFVGLLTWQLEADGIRLLSLMAPEIVGWLTMFEIATYLDVAVAAITASSVIRFGALKRHLRPPTPRARPRSRRSRPVRAHANDDDGDRPADALPLAA